MLIIKQPVGIMGVNCYILGEKTAAIIVDPGSDAKKIVNILKENEITAKYILLTHCHFDHILAVESLMQELDVKLIACQTEKENLLDPSINYTNKYSRTPVKLAADIYVKDGDSVKSGEFEFKVIETPGHTSGGMCLYCKGENLLISGDTLFYASVGRGDLATGNEQMLIKVSKKSFLYCPMTHWYCQDMEKIRLSVLKKQTIHLFIR